MLNDGKYRTSQTNQDYYSITFLISEPNFTGKADKYGAIINGKVPL